MPRGIIRSRVTLFVGLWGMMQLLEYNIVYFFGRNTIAALSQLNILDIVLLLLLLLLLIENYLI